MVDRQQREKKKRYVQFQALFYSFNVGVATTLLEDYYET